MVLYFLRPSRSVEDVRFPGFLLGVHNVFKCFQYGLAAGFVGGAVLCSRKGNLSWALLRHDCTIGMRNMALFTTPVLAPVVTARQLWNCESLEEKKELAYNVQHDKAVNRLHLLTLYGIAAGVLCSRRLQGLDLTHPKGMLSTEVFGVRGGGVALGGFGGYCSDFPVSVFVPIYVSHVDDIPVFWPWLAGLDDDD
ncbi:unnamed protein product [Amoebophrya sp. A120]|nr:unnamed protein product [Amoebophrya sp. A120]|eukprot:GSA120T00005870001.1